MGTDLGPHSMKLHFGVENHAYSQRYTVSSPLTATQKKRRPKVLSKAQQGYALGKTTGEVATDIEKKYGLMEKFFDLEELYIVKNFEEAYGNGAGIGMMGGSWDVAWDPTPLQGKFRRSLTTRRFDGLIPGVPTRSSLSGISHLRQKPKTGRSRASFVNTGLYMRSFRAWLEP